MTSPYLHALACSRCGAPLRAKPGQRILNCTYCGTSHAFVAPPPAEPPGIDYQPGEPVAVEWGGVWWPARVVRAAGPGRWLVNYADWDSAWDEEVDRTRIRHRSAAGGRRVRSSSSRAPLFAAVAFGGLVLVASLSFIVLGQSRATTTTAAPDFTPGASYTAGEAVQVWWQTSWYDGHIESVEGDGEYEISYDGWSSSWNETVAIERLKKKPAPAPAVATTASTGDATTSPDDSSDTADDVGREALDDVSQGSYRKGQSVMIEWRGSWYPGTILSVQGGNRYRIHYDGYSASWDETVGPARLKTR